MQYIVKITSELVAKDWEQLRDLFNESFQRKKSVEWFQRKYRSPIPAISCFHGLMLDENNNIAGAMTIIPFEYNFFEDKAIFGNLIDLMIHKDHRNNILNFKYIYDKLVEAARPSIQFIYAVPNPNSFLYFMKVLKWEEIGKLNYYLWPIRMSKLTRLPQIVDLALRPVSYLAQLLLSPIKSRTTLSPIRKVNSIAYEDYRYSEKYHIISEGEKKAWFRIYDEKGVKTAYIIDIFPMQNTWLAATVKYILKKERANIDIIMYISNTNLGILNLLKAPVKFQPRPLPLIGKVISTGKIDRRIYEMANWAFNLSDFDVR